MTTLSGRQIDIFGDPEPESFALYDISMSLSNICRFGGHLRKFYSVAQHCIASSHVVGNLKPERIDLQLYALLHDVAEAYIGDIVRPNKKKLLVYLKDSRYVSVDNLESALRTQILNRLAPRLSDKFTVADWGVLAAVDNGMAFTEWSVINTTINDALLSLAPAESDKWLYVDAINNAQKLTQSSVEFGHRYQSLHLRYVSE